MYRLELMNIFPRLMRMFLFDSDLPKQIIGNTSWLIADKIIRMGVGFLIGIWVIRYLGPVLFGQLSYTLAFVSLFTYVASMGLDGIVIRDILRNPETREDTLGSAFYLKLLGGCASLVLSLGTLVFLRPDDGSVLILVGIIAVGGIFKAFDVIDFWFQSQVQSKFTVIARSSAFFSTTVMKCVLILTSAPLAAFAATATIEILLGSAGLLYIYYQHGGYPDFWRGSIKRAKSLIGESWPIILSGFFTMLYMKIDQVMLYEMCSDRDVGIYSAAVRISELWYFIPGIIVTSVFPSIVKSRIISSLQYYDRIQKLFRFMALLAYCIIIPVSLCSNFIVGLFYSNSYIESGPILCVHVLATIFVFLGVAQEPWSISEGYFMLSLRRTFVGAVCNILLNLILLPSFKGMGAAVATLISQAVASYLMNFFDKRTRNIFYRQTYALFLMKYERV